MYIRPHLDFGEIIYHNKVKGSMDILETIQCKASGGLNCSKLYAELCCESIVVIVVIITA